MDQPHTDENPKSTDDSELKETELDSVTGGAFVGTTVTYRSTTTDGGTGSTTNTTTSTDGTTQTLTDLSKQLHDSALSIIQNMK